MDRATDAELLHRCRREPEAFAVVYDRWAAELHAWLVARCDDRGAATELTAETFAQALRHAARFRDDADGPWLCGIAGNLLRRYRRTRRVDTAGVGVQARGRRSRTRAADPALGPAGHAAAARHDRVPRAVPARRAGAAGLRSTRLAGRLDALAGRLRRELGLEVVRVPGLFGPGDGGLYARSGNAVNGFAPGDGTFLAADPLLGISLIRRTGAGPTVRSHEERNQSARLRGDRPGGGADGRQCRLDRVPEGLQRLAGRS